MGDEAAFLRFRVKSIIAPLQKWLLDQGCCVGCGRDLAEGKKRVKDGIVLLTCACGRIFVYNPQDDSYRRALFNEV